MSRVCDLRYKEVINIKDGLRFGFIDDLEICTDEGKVKAMIIPMPGKLWGIFGNVQEFRIPWREIKQIGEDIILVDVETDKVRFDCP